jgi:hypothetical protein
MITINLRELDGDVQKNAVTIIGVLAKLYGHIGFCFDSYNKKQCDDCPGQIACLDMFQEEVEADAEKAKIEEAQKVKEEAEEFTARVLVAAKTLYSLDEKCYLCDDRAECVLKMMKKTHTHDAHRPDGRISQSAEKDQYVGPCSCVYKYYEECHDCFCRLDCLAAYIKEGNENDTQAS